MLNQVISFQSENSLSSASRIHPPVTNKCRHFSTGSCKFSHIYDGILPLLALCSMLLFLLFCLPLLTFTRNQIQQKVLAYAIAPPILQTHVIDNWWGVLYPPPALSGGVMPEENSKNQSADSVSDALIFDNDMNWLSQKKSSPGPFPPALPTLRGGWNWGFRYSAAQFDKTRPAR